VPFRAATLALDAQRDYARWLAQQPVAGVAVWAHTGRGPHLSAEERRSVLSTWRAALPDKVIVAGANSVEMAREAQSGGADAVLAFPRREDPVAYHKGLGRELPVIAFYLYEAAGGVAYDDDTLRALLDLPAVTALPRRTVSAHPIAVAEKARVDEARAREQILDRSYYPKLNFQSTVYGRGSGANTDGTVADGLNGLGLERANWAAGMTVTFPLFDIFSIRARKEIERSNERAQAARYDQAIQDLTGQLDEARAALEGARRVAENTPIELKAARDTESQARARYQAGLATIVDVAEAQGLLVQAETDDALARLAVWNNLSSLAAAQGDLQPFLQLLRGKTQGGP